MAYTCSDCTITDCPNQGCDHEGCDELDLTPQESVVVVLDPLELRIAELEKNLADYEKSEPAGRPGAREAKTGDGLYTLDSAQAEIAALDR